jgi:hypothetical protein
MWLRSPKDGSEGFNVTIRKHPAGLPHDLDIEAYVRDPGGNDPIRYEELRRGGNRVQASLDLVFKDEDYDQDRIITELIEFKENRLNKPVSNSQRIEILDGRVCGLFTMNLGPPDARFNDAIFANLIGTIERAFQKNQAKLAA